MYQSGPFAHRPILTEHHAQSISERVGPSWGYGQHLAIDPEKLRQPATDAGYVLNGGKIKPMLFRRMVVREIGSSFLGTVGALSKIRCGNGDKDIVVGLDIVSLQIFAQ